MRGLAVAALLALTGCNPGITRSNQVVPERNDAQPAPAVSNQAPVASTNAMEQAPETAEGPPNVTGMSPYRRREYERGYRDCMSGNFDGERQGESYRIGCMAAEDAKQRRSGR